MVINIKEKEVPYWKLCRSMAKKQSQCHEDGRNTYLHIKRHTFKTCQAKMILIITINRTISE